MVKAALGGMNEKEKLAGFIIMDVRHHCEAEPCASVLESRDPNADPRVISFPF